VAKKSPNSRKMNVYSNLAHKRKTRKDADSRKRAEYLASLPKHPVKRLLYRLHPKRVAGYWFSKKGAKMALKIVGIAALLGVLMVGALFAYYRKDLDAIRPGELAKRVQTTVTKYYDRNGTLLWEDKGDGDYKLVVNGDDISKIMKQATIAIEDKDFYKHGGVSISGIFRSAINNSSGGSTQGGSTLTQQLVKQVFFPPDEAQKRGLDGIPRKIKEMILSIEVERMYNKDQILDLYLNESPYGGRRNGVESGAQTYFGKSSKDLTLPEAALLAAIPNQPGLYDPYNIAGHEALITRQHKVLDSMVSLGNITKAQADEAKKYPILDNIRKESDQYKDIKAPHFVQMVRSQLESELGKATVGRGGLTVKTTIDIRVQAKLEEAMNDMFNSSAPAINGFTNGAGTVEDNQTGQIIAMLGSRSFDYPGYGQDNAATAFIQPGSSIKPLVYAGLFAQKPNGQQNYGSGSILSDTKTTFPGTNYSPKNADGGFKGNINIRQSLALSRNIPAVKAMAVTGIEPSWQTIRDAGDKEYCTQGADAQAGLSSAIGGCGTKQVDHVNAFATLARGGVYKPRTTILEVTNSQGEVLKKWKDESKQVIDPQVAYIISDILTDADARSGLIGRLTTGFSYGNTGIKTSTKTGTSDIGGNKAKDLWMMTYSPAVSMGVWLGNPDTTPLSARATSIVPSPIIDKVMRFVHQEVYGPEGKWRANDWFTQPAGIQKIGKEIYPSWYDKNQSKPNAKLAFDKVSKKKATNCTPDTAKIEVDVNKTTDPVTKKDVFIAPDGYDATKDDDLHKCEDVKPNAGSINVTQVSGSTYKISVSVVSGTHKLQSLEIKVGSTIVATPQISDSGTYSTEYTFTSTAVQAITATVTDSALYTASATRNYEPTGSPDD
jgi:membrane peptidoglycan carboxypeptidase